ncbi:MAG: hypothetical protein R3D80_14320 [Paracoccaceae bacterium]
MRTLSAPGHAGSSDGQQEEISGGTQPPPRFYWPAALIWGAGAVTGVAFYVGLAT